MLGILVIFIRHETKFWLTIVIVFILGLLYLANKLTKGITIGYLKYKMNDRIKNALFFIHGSCSLILALALPNNYLNEISFFKRLYEENEIWIAVSILILLFSFVVIFGTMFTLTVKQLGLERIDEKTQTPQTVKKDRI